MSAGDTGLTTTLVSAAIATAFAAVGWVVNYILAGYRDRENQQSAASLKYVERQIEELYGPLAFLAWEGRQKLEDLKVVIAEMRGNSEQPLFPLLNQQEQKLWIFWVESDLFPRHDKVQELLMTKTHLIEGESLPNSYLNFLNYHNSWKMDHLRWKEQQIEYFWRSRVDFPYEFETDLINTFKDLKIKHLKYLRKLSRKQYI